MKLKNIPNILSVIRILLVFVFLDKGEYDAEGYYACAYANAGVGNIEYVEIYKEISEEGEITERKRRMLERERESLGISEERAKELEENC